VGSSLSGSQRDPAYSPLTTPRSALSRISDHTLAANPERGRALQLSLLPERGGFDIITGT